MKYPYFFCVIFSLTVFTCGKVKKESKKLAVETGQKIKEKAKDAIDKMVPSYDAYKPDTKANKKRFKEFLGVEPTADVKNIVCIDDAIGIDATYKFSFQCDDSTIKKIAAKLLLVKTEKDNVTGLNLGPEVPWWDVGRIMNLEPYWKKGEHETYWYLWFDKIDKQAWFLTFDM